MQLAAGVRERVAAVHGGAELPELLRLYDGWAGRYEQDVAALEYRAPYLAAASLAFAFPSPPAEARVLDVACGTGLVAREVRDGTGRDGMGGAERSSHPPVRPSVRPSHSCTAAGSAACTAWTAAPGCWSWRGAPGSTDSCSAASWAGSRCPRPQVTAGTGSGDTTCAPRVADVPDPQSATTP